MSRRAVHAGTWYHSDPESLRNLISGFLDGATGHHSSTKAIIAPHAGYRYAGKTAAFAYKSVQPSSVKRVFILGPCHHQYIDGCALPDPSISQYETPLGPIRLDQEILNEFRSQVDVPFKTLRLHEDEEEHSIELHLPYLRHIFQSREDVSLIPIYVGSVVQNEERIYGRFLARFFDDPSSLIIISSDFCHWGNRFRFTPRDFPAPHETPLNTKIEELDRQGMKLIALQDSEGFSKYLQTTGNTICGKNCLLIFLQMLRNAQTKVRVDFTHYSQSTVLPEIVSRDDSCVSYAAGVATM